MAEGVRDRNNVCQLCGALEDLQLCGGCSVTWYCSKEHQKYDWQYHKKLCKKKQREKQLKARKEDGSSPNLNLTSTKVATNLGEVAGSHQCVERDDIGVVKLIMHDSDTKDIDCKENINKRNYNDCSNETQSKGEGGDRLQSKIESDVNSMSFRGLDFQDSEEEDTAIFTTEGSSESFILQSDDTALCQPDYSVSAGTESTDSMPLVDTRQTYISIIESRNKELGDYVVNCLNRYGICVIDNFLGESKGREILDNVQYLHESGTFVGGQVVSQSTKATKQIRSDIITWVDGSEPGCDNIQFLISSVDAVILQCAGKLKHYDINGRTKAMVACYPGRGTHYMRHVDNPNKDGRCVTCIYYLNKDWDVKVNGGLLRIFPEGQSKIASVEPKFDRLLFFWSDRRNPHEVMPAFKTRYAITVWYYDSSERKRAVKRFKGSTNPKRTSVPLIVQGQQSDKRDNLK